MEEKNQNEEKSHFDKKLSWEPPKLHCLDKGKTEGSSIYAPTEDGGSYGPS